MIVTFQNHPVIWCLVVFIAMAVLVAWCMAGYVALKHAPLVDDVPVASLPGLRPEESERPFPSPVMVHLSLSDRLERKQEASVEELEGLKQALRKMRDRWGDQVAAEELIHEIDEDWEKRK